MATCDLLWACMENGRLIKGKPSYDNSATWSERAYHELLPFDNADISINTDDGNRGRSILRT
jgi:hypothetical protein